MNNTISKMWEVIQHNRLFSKPLFLFSEIPSDLTLWTGEEGDNYDFSGVTWLYESLEQHFALIGIHTEKNMVVAIDDEGVFFNVCHGLENIPYEVLRLKCRYDTEDQTVQEVFENEPAFKEKLQQYEAWAKAQHIELDKEKMYHDSNGNLFKSWFSKHV